jgi:pimeloyl-ACP methyl ester carboxylesterase
VKAESIYRTPDGERRIMGLYDEALAYWPVPREELRVRTRHGETFIIASGREEAPPLILLHGACSNALSWMGDVAAYSSDMRVYAVDIPGEPGRSSQNRPAWRGAAFAEWLEDVLDALGAPRASLLGISQGGWTALKLATHRPERVSKLVLLAPGGVVPARASFLLRAILFSFAGRAGAAATNRIVFGRQPVDPGVVRFMDEIMSCFRPRIESQPMYTAAELGRLTMPVLVIGGAKDALFDTASIARRLQTAAQDLTARTYPEQGHVLHGLTGDVLSFLAREERSGSGVPRAVPAGS